MISRTVFIIQALLRNNMVILHNSAQFYENGASYQKRRNNFFVLSFCTFCPIFSSIASKLREEMQKNLFYEKHVFVKIGHFLQKTVKISPVFVNSYFSSYFLNHVIEHHHLGDFQHYLADINTVMALKVTKIGQF